MKHVLCAAASAKYRSEQGQGLTEKPETLQLPTSPTAVTSAIWHLLQHLSVGLPPCLQSAARAQIHHGPAFQRGGEGTWALKQSLLSLGLRAPKDLNAVLEGPPHLQGVILRRKKEGNYIAEAVLHFWWGIPHSLGVRQGHEGPRSCPWHWVASAAWRWYSPLSHSMCLNGKAGWWIWAAPWGVFRLQIGSSRSGARLTAQNLSLCPEHGCGYWAAWQMCQCEPGRRMRWKIQCFFLRITTLFFLTWTVWTEELLTWTTNCSVVVFMPVEEPKFRIL